MGWEVVREGRWCTHCEWFEDDETNPDTMTCAACGCADSAHQDAAVTVRLKVRTPSTDPGAER